MQSDKPIIILATPRTRSSMVAAIFAAHGVWTGKTSVIQAGYDGFENRQIKTFLKDTYGPLPDITGDEFYYQPDPGIDLAGFINGLVRENRWLFKCAVNYFHLFRSFDPVFIFVTRNLGDTVDSYVAKASRTGDPMIDSDMATRVIGKRLSIIRSLAMYGVTIDTDEVMGGDLSAVRAALKYAGIKPDESLIDGAIQWT